MVIIYISNFLFLSFVHEFTCNLHDFHYNANSEFTNTYRIIFFIRKKIELNIILKDLNL